MGKKTREELEREVKDLKKVKKNLMALAEAHIAVEARHENTLEWIRFLAGLHYMGDAFDPEHMRAIANMAADSINYKFKSGTEFEDDGRFLPDFEEATEKARSQARKQADKFHRQLDETFRPYYSSEDDEDSPPLTDEEFKDFADGAGFDPGFENDVDGDAT